MDEFDFRCAQENFLEFRTKNDDISTISYLEQEKVEDSVNNLYQSFNLLLEDDIDVPQLKREKHVTFLLKGFEHLSSSYECLDASRPWLCYWILHSLELLNVTLDEDRKLEIVNFLGKCQDEDGGFAGGPGQQPHLAPTYAAVNALCILRMKEAYDIINRKTLQKFLLSRKTAEGAFTMHEGGEEDIRGAYCAASAAKLTNIMIPEMFEGTAEWIVSCQTYEGGFCGFPGMEAHGGYSFCGLAALRILGKEKMCDIKNLLRWTCRRQMQFEGGFQGRTNKLVDGCYSFWQGGAFPLLHMILSSQGDAALSAESWMFHQRALQEYVLICCQLPNGGLVDKPGKSRDYYHTCYCLSGLSVAQHFSLGKIKSTQVIGDPSNELIPTHPIYNIGLAATTEALEHFQEMPTDLRGAAGSKS